MLRSSRFNPITWAIAIVIVVVFVAVAYRVVVTCEPSDFVLFKQLKVTLGGCSLPSVANTEPRESASKKEMVVPRGGVSKNLKQSLDLEKSKEIPDLAKASRVMRALSIKDLGIEGANVKDVSPTGVQGYFSVDIPPSEGAYASANILLSGDVSPNLFVTTRIAGGAGMLTLEIRGLAIWFLLDANADRYMIYNSEENQTYWKILPTSKDPHWNTIGIHQVGRQINAFLNSVYVDSFKLWNTPDRGKVGVYFKADPRIGGKAQFQRLAVYEYE